MKKVLIIGANGYIGSYLTKYFSEIGISVVAFVPIGFREDFVKSFPNISSVEFDFETLLDKDYSNVLNDIEVIFNMAWVGVNAKQRNAVEAQSVNFTYNIRVVQLAFKYGIKRLVVPGSAAEFACSDKTIDGNGESAPSDLYSATKAATRTFCSVLCKQYSIDLMWALVTSIYGPGRDDNNLISYVIKSLLKGEKPSCTKLEQKWDYIYIQDLVQALVAIAEKGMRGNVYAVGSGESRSLAEYVDVIHNAINPQIPIGIGDLPYKNAKLDNQIMDISKLKKDTGFTPGYTFEEGIKTVIDYFKTILK